MLSNTIKKYLINCIIFVITSFFIFNSYHSITLGFGNVIKNCKVFCD